MLESINTPPGLSPPRKQEPLQPAPNLPTLASGRPEAPLPAVQMRGTTDVNALRQAVYDTVERTAGNLSPVVGQDHTLRVRDVVWAGEPKAGKRATKKAILAQASIARRLRGTYELVDNKTGQVVSKKTATLANVPVILDDGSFIRRGTKYMMGYQQRLRPGVYTRRRADGTFSAHANIKPGHGASHQYVLEPEKGLFHVSVRNAKIPIVPLLDSLGASREEIAATLGPELAEANFKKADSRSLGKLYERIVPRKQREEDDKVSDKAMRAKIAEAFQDMVVDEEVVGRTLGMPQKALDKDAVLASLREVIKLSRGEREPDDRDHLAFAAFYSAPDFFSERLQKDAGQVQRKLLFKASRAGNLDKVPSSALDKQIDAAIFASGLAQAAEDVNPAEARSLFTRVTRYGEGGLSGTTATPDESRNLSPGQFGFVDILQTPESLRVGVDGYLAKNTFIGSDNKLYTNWIDAKTGEKVVRNAGDMLDATASLGPSGIPGMETGISKGKLHLIKAGTADYILPHGEELFGEAMSLTPMKGAQAGQRSSMAARMAGQALAVDGAEAPLVQNGVPGTEYDSYENQLGEYFGAVRAKEPGRVIAVSDDEIKIKHRGGRVESIELDRFRPGMRKSVYNQAAMVKIGDEVQPGQLIAKSNFTDNDGVVSLGKNLRAALMSADDAWEDAIVMSRAAANKMRVQTAYQHKMQPASGLKIGRKPFLSAFGNKFDSAQLKAIGDNGAIKPGTVVKKGDPLLLAVRDRIGVKSKIHSSGKSNFADASITWKHDSPGIVTDAVDTPRGINVVVASSRPLEEGDKISGRQGNKGVVTIRPDEQMPVDEDGNTLDIIFSPQSVQSRGNSSFPIEMLLSRIAEKRGKPYRLEGFTGRKLNEFALEEAKKHGVDPSYKLFDPVTGRKLNTVGGGKLFTMALHHLAEAKASSRGLGAYNAEGTPAKGPGDDAQAKRASGQQLYAELSHGALNFSAEHALLRGQRNDDYWAAFMAGNQVGSPKVSTQYEGFLRKLQAMGVNPVKRGQRTQLMGLTDSDIDKLAENREVLKPDTVDIRDASLKPIEGGLHDPKIFGDGRRFGKVTLASPLPNPVFEDPIRKLFGWTEKQFRNVIAGKEELDRYGTGPEAITRKLKDLDVDAELKRARIDINGKLKGKRDAAVKRLGILKTFKKLDFAPSDLMLTKVPVLPPRFRPISELQGKGGVISDDMNDLYAELIRTNEATKEMQTELGDAEDGRLALYDAYKAVVGMSDPTSRELKSRQVKGLLKQIIGGSPKQSTVQRKLLSGNVDTVSRAVLLSDSSLGVDEAGIPEDLAFKKYEPYLVRALVQRGFPITAALEEVRAKTDNARDVLLKEIERRPLVVTRAPILHRGGQQGFRPKLIQGKSLKLPPTSFAGYNADSDGDTLNMYVPHGPREVSEVYDKLLPSRSLISPADMQSPNLKPSQDLLMGLYQASKRKSGRKTVRVFATKEDMRKAYENNEIDINDPVRVMEG